ncbi:MAG: MFS transporter, partial [Pseudonocardia sp.]|nr:MFS transporter [Pseudonocardia sp.]
MAEDRTVLGCACRYRIGMRLWQIGSLAPVARDLRDTALPFLQDLAAGSGHLVRLVVLDGHRALFLERLAGHSDVRVRSRVGRHLPLHASGPGKDPARTRPTGLPPGRARRRVGPARAAHHHDPARLHEALADARRTGSCLSRDEMTDGTSTVAAPVSGPGGDVVAAVSVVVPSSVENLQLLVPAVRGDDGGHRPGAASLFRWVRGCVVVTGSTIEGVHMTDSTTGRTRRWVAPLLWSAVALEGFDIVVIGVVLGPLLRDTDWGLTPATGALMATLGILGILVGALTTGPLTDIIGRRRRAMIGTVAAFSVLTLLCAFALDPYTFGALRFLAGVFLGGMLPVALAMAGEEAPDGKTGSATTTLMTGYHVGAVLTALLGILLIPTYGWRAMFVAGALPALLLVPLLIARLPESVAFQRVAGVTRNPVAVLFQPGYRRASIAIWVASFMGLLLVYGLNTWLPEIMRSAGYPLGDQLGLLLALNAGAVLGLLIAGQVANRIGVRTSVIGWFAGAAVFLALLAIRLPGAGVYVSVILAGVFVFSSQVLVYAYVAQ